MGESGLLHVVEVAVIVKPLNPCILFLLTISQLNHTQRHEDKEYYHQLKKLLIVKQILLADTSGNLCRMV